MNLAPSDFPLRADPAGVSKPGFDIMLAISGARQAALPTVQLLRERAARASHVAMVGAVRGMFGGTKAAAGPDAPRPVRFFDLSDGARPRPETVNSLFTRGFQPMLSPFGLDTGSSALPIPHDEDIME